MEKCVAEQYDAVAKNRRGSFEKDSLIPSRESSVLRHLLKKRNDGFEVSKRHRLSAAVTQGEAVWKSIIRAYRQRAAASIKRKGIFLAHLGVRGRYAVPQSDNIVRRAR